MNQSDINRCKKKETHFFNSDIFEWYVDIRRSGKDKKLEDRKQFLEKMKKMIDNE